MLPRRQGSQTPDAPVLKCTHQSTSCPSSVVSLLRQTLTHSAHLVGPSTRRKLQCLYFLPIARTHVGFQASSLPYLRRLQVWVYPLVMICNLKGIMARILPLEEY